MTREMNELVVENEFDLGAIQTAVISRIEIATRRELFPEARQEDLKYGGTLEDELVKITFSSKEGQVLGAQVYTKRYSPQSKLFKLSQRYKKLRIGAELMVTKNDRGSWEVMI